MATKPVGQKGIMIKCQGMYYYKTESAKGTKPYSIDVRAPSLEFFREHASKYKGMDAKGRAIIEDRSFINIRGALKKRLLPILLQKKFSDFARVKYVVILEVISESGEELDLPLYLRSQRQLAELVKQEKMPIDAGSYINIDELRTDILEYQTDPDSFNRDKVRRDKRRMEEQQFKEMNNIDESLPPVREKKSAGGIDSL